MSHGRRLGTEDTAGAPEDRGCLDLDRRSEPLGRYVEVLGVG